MKEFKFSLLSLAVATSAVVTAGHTVTAAAESISDALKSGTTTGDFRLRYEAVDQDNTTDDASALTLRSRVGYTTGTVSGFSATIEFEDVRIVAGQSEYTDRVTHFHTDFVEVPGESPKEVNQYSIIADPETTELDQGFLKYSSDKFTAKLGRQVITYDGHRFVGHVGWRQDRQTFDGLTLSFNPIAELALNYGYIEQRNRIFAEAADVDSKDHLFNAAYTTPVGTLVGYAYLLEVDNDTDNALDTYGVSFTGKANAGDLGILYSAEFATQSSESGNVDYDAEYMLLEGGVSVNVVTAKLGYESLGSDSGKYGFSTPLATLHKFNGWSDQFLNTPAEGLIDLYVLVSAKVGPGSLTAVWHDFEADESSDTVDDLGSELDLSYGFKFGGSYNAGIKYAAYSAGDDGAGKVDTDKLWVWVGASF